MNLKIGSYGAKTKLPELLRGIQAGRRYTITLRGQAIAELLPVLESKQRDTMTAVDDMLSFMRSRQPLAHVDIKVLIEDGRA